MLQRTPQQGELGPKAGPGPLRCAKDCLQLGNTLSTLEMPSTVLSRPPRTRARSGSGSRPRRKRAASGLFGGNGGGDDLVCATIHEAGLDHRLPPGTKLKEVPLAELFGVTRAVIRKSLARLAHMRLVELRPNRGAVV